ncbi:MAG: 4-hydroxythreonine-4-phosphate dehydrogenase PdxA, partial [Pseudomonadota bacterium]|nr:4-hydroxythreonine-4-phosphate dehydrogenase PdxA [Pseudomonadota bacterium]
MSVISHAHPELKPVSVLVVTAGEPAGIGPDLVLMHHIEPGTRVVVVADRDMLESRAKQLGLDIPIIDYKQNTPITGKLEVLHIPLVQPTQPGQLNPKNSPYVLETIKHAVSGCLSGEFSALVTGPTHKGIINDAGIPFTGHTEFLAQLTSTPVVVMMLIGGGLKVALATTHLPLSKVSESLSQPLLESVLRVMHDDLQFRFKLIQPRILVAGLNPHAGESGHLGHEEIEIIHPVINRLRQEGMKLTGPLPADTLFTPPWLSTHDAVLAMYHDQGLAVLKYASFGKGVNVTLGLPIIRTSVDHGTALD